MAVAVNEKISFYNLIFNISEYFMKEAENSTDPLMKAEYTYYSILEGIKALTYYFELKIHGIEAIKLLTNILGDWIENIWNIAFSLHYDIYAKNWIDEEYINYAMKEAQEFNRRIKEVIY